MNQRITKISVFFSVLSIILVLVNPVSYCSASWGVEPADSLELELTSINVDYQTDIENYSANYITFGVASNVPEGDLVNFSVVNTNASSVDYQLSHDIVIENHQYNQSNFEKEMKDLMLLPIRFGQKVFDLDDLKRGFTGIDYPIVSTDNTTWEFYDNYDNPYYLGLVEKLFTENATVFLQAKYSNNESIDTAFYEWHSNGTYTDTSKNTSIDFVHKFLIAYQYSTGLLLGLRLDMDIEGIREGEDIIIILQSEVLQPGFNLDDFTLPTEHVGLDELLTGLFPGFSLFITSFTIGTLIILYKVKKK
ncbi:MAG: choice-of-anchor S family protein [Asgard group archaeon]|nr:choice-of-anchor S family protein [Asgard group archaeon]